VSGGRAERRSEAGFTIVELAITMAIAMTVMGSILGILVSQSKAERRVSAFADNQEELRQAVVAMQRDIRSSEPLQPLTTSPEYALRIELDVYEDISDPAPIPVRWVVDLTTSELRRELLDSTTRAVTGITHRVRGVANNYAVPLFRFYKAASNTTPDADAEYKLAPTDPPADIASCTVRIRIELLAAPNPGPQPARLISDVQLRNRLPGGAPGCLETTATP